MLVIIACGDDASCDEDCDAAVDAMLDAPDDAGMDDGDLPDAAPIEDGGAIDAEPDAGVARCDDGIRNGTESDVDCGGLCPGCGAGASCSEDADCSTDGCVASICRVGPSAGFTLTPYAGEAPILITATSEATPGDAPLALVEYDFGGGYRTTHAKVFPAPGSFIVRQRVTDENGLSDIASQTVAVAASGFDCRLSATDKSPDEVVSLTSDRLAAEWHSSALGGVRSECAATAGSGVFYFEASLDPYECDPGDAPLGCIPTPRGTLNLGVGTAAAELTTFPGSTDAGFDLLIAGGLYGGGEFVGPFPVEAGTTWGFVVDYRGGSPTVHLLGASELGPRVLFTRALATNAPVHAMATGNRRKVGVDASFNFGVDTQNEPFAYDVDALLRAAGLEEVASALVLGWTGTRARPPNARPTLSVPGDMSVTLGTTVTLVASATDAEEGDLSERIVWEDLATVYGVRDGAEGTTFAYTPRTLGLHPIRVTVADSFGARRQAIVRLNVTGVLPTPSVVRLVDDPAVDPLVGRGIALSADGLSVRWTDPDKMALRANQGLYGDFWYFEVSRLIGPENQGAGLVVAEGDLDPYREELVPPSYTINTLGGSWQNLIFRAPYDTSSDTYGFAVDYRGASPLVYFIVGGEVADVWPMYDVFVPVYPMLFGQLTPASAPFDLRANLGATPFSQDPCQALAAYGVAAAERSELHLGWGAHASVRCP